MDKDSLIAARSQTSHKSKCHFGCGTDSWSTGCSQRLAGRRHWYLQPACQSSQHSSCRMQVEYFMNADGQGCSCEPLGIIPCIICEAFQATDLANLLTGADSIQNVAGGLDLVELLEDVSIALLLELTSSIERGLVKAILNGRIASSSTQSFCSS